MQKSLLGKAAKTDNRSNRAPRACLRCRTQKIRCDGFAQTGGKCSACKSAQIPCQYIETSSSLNRMQKRYIQTLEERNEKLEALLRKLHPDESFPELGDPVDQPTADPLTAKTTTYPIDSLIVDFDAVQLENDQRFYGKFSNSKFARLVLESRLRDKGMQWKDFLQSLRFAPGSPEPKWVKMPGWQRSLLSPNRSYRLSFPPDDLMASLLDYYFVHENPIRPILHRPTFEAMVQSRLHEKDQYFGGLVLIVCACGSRYSKDPRTRTKDDIPDSAGWLYYEQVHRLPRPMSEPVSLVRLQLFNLMLIFLNGSCLFSLEWSLIGIGLRLALDIGAHLNSSFASAPLAEREQWKRAFWGLFVADQVASASLGRSGVIPPEEIDLDLPLEVDDEYWYPQDSSHAFVQPADKPSTISGFNALVRLMCLMPKVIQITKGLGAASQEYEQETLELVTELDSSLNQWLESLPSHLQWKPFHQNPAYFTQSSMLHTTFYQTIIIIHRPFIPQVDNIANSGDIDRATSFAICKNAARSLARVLQTYAARCPKDGGAAWMFLGGFNAAVILLLDYWGKGGTKREDIEKCVASVAICEERYVIAGALRDALQALLPLGEDPSTPPAHTNSSGAGEITGSAVVASASADPRGSLNNPPSTGVLAGLASLLDLAELPPSAFLPSGSWSGDAMDQIFAANFGSSPTLPVPMECEAALLQDWSQQDDTSDWAVWDFLSSATETAL